MMKKNIGSSKISALIITGIVLGVLVLSGPANAFVLNLHNEGDSMVKQGKKIKFIAKVDIQNLDTYLPIENLVLVLEGPEKTIGCEFDVTGKLKSGVNDACHGINIKKIAKSKLDFGYGYGYGYHNGYGYNFGYGYGYNEQTLEYEITIHTQKFKVGDYDTELRIIIGGKTFSEKGSQFKILEKHEKEHEEEHEKEHEEEHEKEHEEEHEKEMVENVVVCHIPPGNPSNMKTLKIGSSALQAHLNHGDYEGKCERESLEKK